MAGQVGHDHEGALQHRHQQDVAPLVVPRDLRSQLAELGLELLARHQDPIDRAHQVAVTSPWARRVPGPRSRNG